MADRCKYQKLQYQVSYDDGTTWENAIPEQVKKGNIIEYMSADCSEIETLYRWVDLQGRYTCVGNKKYTTQIQEESYDGGVSWYTSYPTVYQANEYVGDDPTYCCDKFVGHYVADGNSCPNSYVWNGYKCVYTDPLKVVKCDGTSVLTSGDTRYYGVGFQLLEAEIGNTVTTIGTRAFYGCRSLPSITIQDSVTSIGDEAFYYCSGLTSCTIGSGVTSIGDEAFYRCSSLTSCTIGSSVTSIGNSAFTYCSGLASINIPDSVTSIGDRAFIHCSGLTSCTIGSGVTTIGNGAFQNCYRLRSITIPSGVTSIGNYAFIRCTNIASITCLATTPPALGSSAFNDTNNCPIYVLASNVNAYKTASGWSSYASRIQAIP